VPRGQPDFYTIIREKGVETLVYDKAVILPGYGETTLLDIKGQDITVQVLEIGCDSAYIALWFWPYNAAGETPKSLRLAAKDGSTFKMPSAYEIHTHESILFSELIYDTTNNWYKFGMGYPLRFGHGLKIQAENLGATEQKVAIVALVLIHGP